MAKYKVVIDGCIWRCIISALLCAALYSTPAHAVWTYSLAAQIAMHDGILAACGKIEPRINAVLSDEWSKLERFNKIKAIRSARKSSEYLQVYRLVLSEQLKTSWGDSEEEAHECERVYIDLSHGQANPNQWWRDRPCTNVPLNSVEGSGEGQRCGAGPRAEVSFENTVSDANISILRLLPSSDVSFPPAGTFPQWSDLRYRIVSINNVGGHVWAIPESVEFEWKEWPRTFPGELKNEPDLKSVRLYVDEVRGKVERKRAQLVVRGRIPGEVIAEALLADRAANFGQPVTGSLKLFFIFMQDGVRFRWEQWNGKCIKRYGGDEIDLPRHQLLSGDWVCGEPEPKRCGCETKAN